MNIPRMEYPRPQMVRPNWMNLNGTWEFEMDISKSGKARKLQEAPHLSGTITVPFCPESELSGVGFKDFMNAVWYQRTVTLPPLTAGEHVLLHFEAVDYTTDVWVGGTKVGSHFGGYTPFTFHITAAVCPGENRITVCAEDDCRDPLIPRGKQSEELYSHGCEYTRTTGIWQTVWLEITPASYIANYRVNPDPDNSAAHFEVFFAGTRPVGTLTAAVTYQEAPVGKAVIKVSGSQARFSVSLSALHLWEPGHPALYDVAFTLECEDGTRDVVTAYFGMRTVALSGSSILLIGKPLFQRLVLDQGFYPDGICTAPSDEALKRDIALSMAMGFNGARLHQKVFERRFLYWADKLGYLVWGEYGNWGLDLSDPASLEAYLIPWMEAVQRDYNSPALVGWCPFNETWDYRNRPQDNMVLLSVYKATKALDTTRPVIDTSGNFHVATDSYDVHDYEQDVEKFASHYAPMQHGGPVYDWFTDRQSYGGQPYFVSEYGGIFWDDEHYENGWGYGSAPKSMAEYAQRFIGLTRTLMDNPRMCGLCYTQLYDVEQERNGIYTYGRKLKFPADVAERMRSAMAAPAAIELPRTEQGAPDSEKV